jgi:hypothetical protein
MQAQQEQLENIREQLIKIKDRIDDKEGRIETLQGMYVTRVVSNVVQLG